MGSTPPLVDDVHPGQDNATIMHVAMPWGVVPGCTHWCGDGIVVQKVCYARLVVYSYAIPERVVLAEPIIGVDIAM